MLEEVGSALVGEGRRINAEESFQVRHDMRADLAHLILRGVFAELIFIHGDVVVQIDNRPVRSIAILHGHDPVQRLIGARQIVDPNIKYELGRGGRTP